MKHIILFAFLTVRISFAYCQSSSGSEMLIAKDPKINGKCSVLNIHSSNKANGGFLINYVLMLKAAIGAEGESEMNGAILKNNQAGSLSYVPNSDKVLMYISQEIDGAGKTIGLTAYPIAFRDFDKSVDYKVKSCEKNNYFDAGFKFDYNVAAFFSQNNILQEDKNILKQYLESRFNKNTKEYAEPQISVAETFETLGKAFENISAVPFKKGEVLRSETNLNGLSAFVMFDKTVKKEQGNSVHRIYFTTDKKELTLVDSIVSPDEYSFLESKKVFSTKGTITGLLSTFIVEKKLEGKEKGKNFFAVYTDINGTSKKWSFKTGENKWSSFKTQICVNYGDSILVISHCTTGLMSYHRQVHLFYSTGDVKKTYPTVEIKSDDNIANYLSSAPAQGVSLGEDCELLTEIIRGDFEYLMVQGKQVEGQYIKTPKSTSTVTSLTKKYTVPVVYQLKNNELVKIYTITNTFFEAAPLKAEKICNDALMAAYLLSYPHGDDVILKLDNSSVTIIPESKDGYVVQKMLNNNYVVLTSDKNFYLVLKNTSTQNLKLVKF